MSSASQHRMLLRYPQPVQGPNYQILPVVTNHQPPMLQPTFLQPQLLPLPQPQPQISRLYTLRPTLQPLQPIIIQPSYSPAVNVVRSPVPTPKAK